MKKFICVSICFIVLINSLTVSAYNTSAKAAVVINGYTGEILYSQNCDQKLPMASTTKIMTALLLCELGGDLSQTVVTTHEMVTIEGSSMGLQIGDTVSYHDLLYGMLLASGNDAANTTAIAIGGSVSDFVNLMNDKATQLGLNNTHFVTPSGLDAEGHYTTAYELALIAKEALNNRKFAEAAASKSAVLCYGNPPYNRTLTNHNKLLKMYDDIVGVKTGFTKKSGRCLVSASKKEGKYIIAVTLNDSNDWQDHRILLDLGLSMVESKKFSPTTSQVNVNIVTGNSLDVTIPSATISVTEKSKVDYVIKLSNFLYAPIKYGEDIGKVCYYCNDVLLCELPITSSQEVKYNGNNMITLLQIFKNMILTA